MKQGKFSFIVKILSLLIIQGCSVPKNITEEKTVKMPASFLDQTDSLSIGDLDIETLFADKQLVSMIRISLENNQDVLIASQRIAMAKANYKISKGVLFPTLFVETAAG